MPQRVMVESLNEKGLGRASLEIHGKKREIVVPYTLPGEEVQVYYSPKKAELIKVLSPSLERQKPKCKHFAFCGGCSLQHMPYKLQLQQKQEYIEKLFGTALPILACDNPWRYRNKMEFSFSQTAKEKFLGLKGAKGRVVDLEECHLVDPVYCQVLAIVRKWWKESSLEAYHHQKDQGSLRSFVIRHGKRSQEFLFVLHVSGNPQYAIGKKDLKALEDAFKNRLQIKFSFFLRIQQIQKGSPTQFFESKICGEEFLHEKMNVQGKEFCFSMSPQAFFQPNTEQAEKFYQKALELAEISEEDLVYDLYCGTGTIGILASFQAKKVLGVELCPDACVDARQNIADLGIKNMEVLQGDVAELLESLQQKQANLLIVDPPRAGLGEKAMKHLKALNAEKILYISCNPKTQAEDLKSLPNYSIKAVQPIDAFPQTAHVENIVFLKQL